MSQACIVRINIRNYHNETNDQDNITPTATSLTIYGIDSSGLTVVEELAINGAETTCSLPATYTHIGLHATIKSWTYRGQSYTAPDGMAFDLFAIGTPDAIALTLDFRQTIATVYCFQQLIDFSGAQPVGIETSDRSMKIALKMNRNFTSENGYAADRIKNSPNGLETNSWPLWHSLANVCCSLTVNAELQQQWYTAEQGAGASVVQWLYRLAQNPFEDADQVWAWTEAAEHWYTPCLQTLQLPKGHSAQPNQWTLTIKVNDSGSKNFLISGLAFVVFDENDRAWISNNFRQGTPLSGTHTIVLECDGSPAPFSPVFGGGTLGPGFGIANNAAGDRIYVGNFGWGPTECNPQEGSIAVFHTDGTPISPPNGYTKGLSRVQGLAADAEGNLWISSYGTQTPLAPAPSVYPYKGQPSGVTVYLKDNSEAGIDYEHPLTHSFGSPYRKTFGVAIAEDGTALVSCAGNHSEQYPERNAFSGVYRLAIDDNKQQLNVINAFDPSTNPDFFEGTGGFMGFRQVTTDRAGNVYVGAIRGGMSQIIRLNPDLTYHSSIDSEINRPWGVLLDGADTLFSGNFGFELEEGPSGKQLPVGSTGVTLLKKNAEGEYPEGHLMTLPTGGAEVTLPNGFPLYGVLTDQTNPHNRLMPVDQYIPCYSPLMRITSTQLDRVGNLWVVNNWKPSAAVDLLQNPGGDGVVIFVGVACPRALK